MIPHDVREEAKTYLANELGRFLHPGPKFDEARRWGEDWIDARPDVTPQTDPKRLGGLAANYWRAAHPTVTP